MAVAMNDAYSWLVIYQNGTEFHEFDEPGTIGRGFAEVDSTHVEKLALVTGTFPAFVVNVPEEATPIFFRRRSISLNLIDESMTRQGTVHCIGWKHEEKATYLFVFEDGSSLLTDDLQAV